MNLPSITRAYLAGMTDGEGYIGITLVRKGEKKHWGLEKDATFRAEINITSTNKSIIKWIGSLCDGYVDGRDHSQPNRKRSYAWEARKTNQCASFLKLVYPYLKIKKPQADVLLRFLQTFNEPRKRRGIVRGKPTVSEAIHDKRAQLYMRIRELNMRGTNRNALETTRQEILSLGFKI